MARRYEDTSYGNGRSRFQTTEWTQILNSQLGGSILAELYAKYWRPAYSYLRRKGLTNEEAKDVVQGFFSEKVLGQQLLLKADRRKGKFRTFLLTALSNYATDLHRKKRPTQALDQRVERASDTGDPAVGFDMVWAQELLRVALQELEKECRIRAKDRHWEVFRAWLLETDVGGDKADMSEICARYGIDDATKGYNMVSNLKGRFRKILRRSLRSHVDTDDQVDDEIGHFVNIFSGARQDIE